MNSPLGRIVLILGVAITSWMASAFAHLPVPSADVRAERAKTEVWQLASALPAVDTSSHVIDVHSPVVHGDSMRIAVVIRRKLRCTGSVNELAQPQQYAIYERGSQNRWTLTKLGLMAPAVRPCEA